MVNMRDRQYEVELKPAPLYTSFWKNDKKSLLPEEVRKLKNHLSKGIFLNDILEGSMLTFRLMTDQNKINPELQKRLSELRSEQENEQYLSMTKNTKVFVTGKSPIAPRSQHTPVVDKSVQKQLTMVLNFFISLFLTYFTGHWLAAYFTPELAIRVLSGMIIASVVAVAEIFIFFRYWL